MGGKACIRGLRVTVGTVVGLLAAGRSREEILKAYPYLEPEDIDQALSYAAWRLDRSSLCVLAATLARRGTCGQTGFPFVAKNPFLQPLAFLAASLFFPNGKEIRRHPCGQDRTEA